MEKISSILPTNSRIRKVDLSNSQPQRPGTPDFGQRMGRNSAVPVDKVTLTSSAERAMQDTLGGYNPRETRLAKIAAKVTNDFFETRLEGSRRGETADRHREALEADADVAVERPSRRGPAELKKMTPEVPSTVEVSTEADGDSEVEV